MGKKYITKEYYELVKERLNEVDSHFYLGYGGSSKLIHFGRLRLIAIDRLMIAVRDPKVSEMPLGHVGLITGNNEVSLDLKDSIIGRDYSKNPQLSVVPYLKPEVVAYMKSLLEGIVDVAKTIDYKGFLDSQPIYETITYPHYGKVVTTLQLEELLSMFGMDITYLSKSNTLRIGKINSGRLMTISTDKLENPTIIEPSVFQEVTRDSQKALDQLRNAIQAYGNTPLEQRELSEWEVKDINRLRMRLSGFCQDEKGILDGIELTTSEIAKIDDSVVHLTKTKMGTKNDESGSLDWGIYTQDDLVKIVNAAREDYFPYSLYPDYISEVLYLYIRKHYYSSIIVWYEKDPAGRNDKEWAIRLPTAALFNTSRPHKKGYKWDVTRLLPQDNK